MLTSSASAIRETLAGTVLKCAQTQGQSELIALAWALRNRVERTRNGADDEAVPDAEEVSRVSQALLADISAEAAPESSKAHGNGHAKNLPHDEMAFQQALACVSLVFDGLLPDPTNGASRVHPHDQAPAWAGHCEATALIGPLLFLRESSDSEDADRSDWSERS